MTRIATFRWTLSLALGLSLPAGLFAAAGDVELLSFAATVSASAGGMSNGPPGRTVSADGRYVVFVSTADNLVPGQIDTNNAYDVFLRDRMNGTTVLVSHTGSSLTTAGNGTSGGNGLSATAVISEDGRYVAFESNANDLGFFDSNSFNSSDVILFDRDGGLGSSRLVSHADTSLTSSPSTGASHPLISADGRYVAFHKSMGNEILLFDRDGALGSRRLVASDAYEELAMSRDGRYVAFASTADLAPFADGNGASDVFLFDRDGGPGSLRLVSHSEVALTSTGNAASFEPAISDDGRYVVFASLATDLGFDDANGDRDLFLFDRDGDVGSLRLVSHTGSSLTTTANLASYQSTISSDGRYVAFESAAYDLGFTDTNGIVADILLFDRDGALGSRRLVSHNASSLTTTGIGFSHTPAISSDGRYVAFTSVAYDMGFTDSYATDDVFLFDRDDASGALRLASHQAGSGTTTGNGGSSGLAISSSGPVVAFASGAFDLVAGDDNQLPDVFVFDAASPGDCDLVSRRDPGLPSVTPNGDSPLSLQDAYAPGTVSDDGRYVVFVSRASNLLANQFDLNGGDDIFLYDRQTGTTVLVSHDASSFEITGDAGSNNPSISGDGRFVAFQSYATNLGGTDANGGEPDIFLFDREGDVGSTVLVSHNGSSLETSANARSERAVISRDGRYVVFVSPATDLGFTDVNGSAGDVFLYERGGGLGSRRLVSHNAISLSTTANAGSGSPAISRDGRYVAFESYASDLGFADSNGAVDVVLFDRDGGPGSHRLASHSSGSLSTAANSGSYTPVISDHGRFVAFQTTATDLGFDDPNGTYTDVVLFDRDGALGSRRLVSHNGTSLTTCAASFWGGSLPTVISGDGRYVAFTTINSSDTEFGALSTSVLLFDSEGPLGSRRLVGAGGSRPSISADGRFVTFESSTGGYGFTDANATTDVFLFDRDAEEVKLVSHRAGSLTTTGNGKSFGAHLSTNGELVVFSSSAPDLVAGDHNSFNDMFAYSNEQPRWSLFTLTPCRVFDTREAADAPAISGGTLRLVTLHGACGIPATARAVAANVTVTGPTAAGHLLLYPSDVGAPNASTINFSGGQTRANNAIVRLDVNGTLAVKASVAGGGTVHVIIDVVGYFAE
jgi:Tol biopolymer transport system component